MRFVFQLGILWEGFKLALVAFLLLFQWQSISHPPEESDALQSRGVLNGLQLFNIRAGIQPSTPVMALRQGS